MFRPVRVTAPSELPVSVDDCKRNGVVDFSDDDVLLAAMLQAAVDHLDGFRGILGRCMVNQDWRVEMACFERSFILPVPDVSAVVITYVDALGASQTVAAENISFYPVAKGTMVALAADFVLPELQDDNPAPVQVQFTAGYGAAANVPGNLKVGIMQLVRQMYDDRGGALELRPGSLARDLIMSHRWLRV